MLKPHPELRELYEWRAEQVHWETASTQVREIYQKYADTKDWSDTEKNLYVEEQVRNFEQNSDHSKDRLEFVNTFYQMMQEGAQFEGSEQVREKPRFTGIWGQIQHNFWDKQRSLVTKRIAKYVQMNQGFAAFNRSAQKVAAATSVCLVSLCVLEKACEWDPAWRENTWVQCLIYAGTLSNCMFLSTVPARIRTDYPLPLEIESLYADPFTPRESELGLKDLKNVFYKLVPLSLFIGGVTFDTNCPICFDDFSDGRDQEPLPCGRHLVHPECNESLRNTNFKGCPFKCQNS